MSTWDFKSVYQWSNFVQFWLLPSTCVLCNQPGQPQLDLCESCAAKLPSLLHPCPLCALPLPQAGLACGRCLQGKTLIQCTISAFAYEEPVSSLVGQFKYQRKLAAGKVLTTLLERQVRAHYRDKDLPELLLPVPLHRARLCQRGYNQALLMSRDLSRALHIPVAAGLIHRHRATPAQQGLKAKERRRNLRGAFAVATDWRHTQYQRIALIDDVVTTMSTVSEVARELQRACDRKLEIHVWCLARA